jgi:hypothetical protein
MIKLSALDIETLTARYGETITRVLDKHVLFSDTSVEEARNKFSSIMKDALDGKCQVIGKRRSVVMLSMETLAEMLQEAAMPATWGQAFDPTDEFPGITETLQIAEDQSPRETFLDAEVAEVAEVAQAEKQYHSRAAG